MARPTDLEAFVFAKLPVQGQDHLPDLPDLSDIPGGGADLPAVQFPEPALDALADLPTQTHVPDFFDLG